MQGILYHLKALNRLPFRSYAIGKQKFPCSWDAGIIEQGSLTHVILGNLLGSGYHL